MIPQPPPGQGPIDPRGAFAPPPAPGNPGAVPGPGAMPPGAMPPGFMPPPMGFGPPGGYPPVPPGGFPPPGWIPPQPPPKRGGFGRAMLTTFATTLFGFSLLLNVYLILFNGLMSDRSSKSKTIQTGDPRQVIAVVPIVNTMISQKEADQFDKLMDEAEQNADVKALVLRIDTPGGEIAPSDEMYHRIERFKAARPHVPVVVSMGALATSGGYYAACGADYLIAEPTTETVNVGVYSMSLNFSRLLDKWGIDDATIRATHSPFKTAGSPLRPPTTQETEYRTQGIDAAYDRFRSVVAKGRNGKLKSSLDTVCNGKAYTADEALKLGAVDQVGYAEDAYKYAATAAGLTSATIVQYEEQPSILALLEQQSKSELPARQASGDVKINGMPIEIPRLHQMLDPRPMYLYSPE